MDLQDIKRIGQAAIARHGEAKQVMMAVEECGELLTSLSQHSRGRVPSAAVVEEAADVIIMATQVGMMFGLEGELENAIISKLERLRGRLGLEVPHYVAAKL